MEKTEAVVIRTVNQSNGQGARISYTEAEGINPVTGEKQTFRGTVHGSQGFLGMRAQKYPKKGEKIEVAVNPDRILFSPNSYEMTQED